MSESSADDVLQLTLKIPGTVDNLRHLKRLFALFALTLNRLASLDSADEEFADVHLFAEPKARNPIIASCIGALIGLGIGVFTVNNEGFGPAALYLLAFFGLVLGGLIGGIVDAVLRYRVRRKHAGKREKAETADR